MKLLKTADSSLDQSGVLVFSRLRNEISLLPVFFNHYRKLGVSEFIIVDNESVDGSFEYLEAQKDVTLYTTDEQYEHSRAGLIWTDYLKDQHGINRWCLTVDIDELLVFPFAEHVNLGYLVSYLDHTKSSGIFSLMLDLYPNTIPTTLKLETYPEFLQECFYDPNGLFISESNNHPSLSVYGGVRRRVFMENGKLGRGPVLKKIPLVKWENGLGYAASTHSLENSIILADITSCLLHLKLLNDIEAKAKLTVAEINTHGVAAKRKRRLKMENAILDKTRDHSSIVLKSEASKPYNDTFQLIEDGLLKSSDSFHKFLVSIEDQNLGQMVAKLVKEKISRNNDEIGIEYSQLLKIWGSLDFVTKTTFED